MPRGLFDRICSDCADSAIFYSALDLEALPEVTLTIVEGKKKIIAGLKVDLKAVGLTNKAKEETFDIKGLLGSNSIGSILPSYPLITFVHITDDYLGN
jgi:hypothetical protein